MVKIKVIQMKNLVSLSITIIVLSLPFFSHAQQNKMVLIPLLHKYYNIKNSLVNSDVALASKEGNEFFALLKQVEIKTLETKDQILFKSLESKFEINAKKIADTKDIKLQRLSFSELSETLRTLLKNTKLISEVVYVDYCHMKKVYWLSNESSIRNPYYGNTMLTCGSINETLK